MNDRELAKQNAARIEEIRARIEEYKRQKEAERKATERVEEIERRIKEIATQNGYSLEWTDDGETTWKDVFLGGNQ